MAAPGPWLQFDCAGAVHRWRYHDDGRIEVEGRGIEEASWPSAVNQWRPLIEASADRNALPSAWVASTMAQETGGRSVCLSATTLGACGAPCECVPNEGAGLMATLPMTASSMMGRKVSSQQLLDDPELAIEAGTRYLKYQLDRYDGEFVHAAVGYNAGSVKCGRGGVFVPAGKDWPKQRCPDTGWGIVFGCVYADRKYGTRCAPSGPGAPKPYICSTNYAGRAVQMQNAARTHYEGRPLPIEPEPVLLPWGPMLTFAAASAAGYFGAAWLAEPGRRPRVARVFA